MDPTRFDRLTQTLSIVGSRRAALAAVGAAFALARGQFASAQTCAANDERCGRATDLPCCSGRCKRKSGSRKKFCRQADHQGVCTVEDNICGGNVIRCGDASVGGSCDCYVTTAGHSFCGDEKKTDTCGCTSNRQCQRKVGKGAKCVQVNTSCTSCEESALCATPCQTLDPVP